MLTLPDIHIVIAISSSAIHEGVKLLAFICMCVTAVKVILVLKRGDHA